jgi:hypothetical protein
MPSEHRPLGRKLTIKIITLAAFLDNSNGTRKSNIEVLKFYCPSQRNPEEALSLQH